MSSDEVFLTGATGFIGSHVLDSLLDAGYRVRALCRPGSTLHRDDCTRVEGDLITPGDLLRSLDGCRYLVHVAALYSFAPRDHAQIRETNVAGTAGLLEVARIAGVERAVVTSSAATVGPARGRLATEHDVAVEGHHSPYHDSKLEQERAALSARVPVVLVLPTAPVGTRDRKPTPTGKMMVDFMRGRIVASLGGGLNVVDVTDVARAHVAALERGRLRERYLVGGSNLSLDELWQLLAQITGRRAPEHRIPYGIALAAGYLDTLRCRLFDRDPTVPLEGVHMAQHAMHVDDSKARTEFGHRPSPVPEALSRAVSWFRQNGYA
ncbi:MAG TPA: NAD-dependent epimerase/dehydratase family protein [Chloroflexota bacterium]|nr:NAD-dependent epimerase/dehydratase family protein [Chloroflexota bacterium]